MTLDTAILRACDYAGTYDTPRALLCYYADVAQKEIAITVAPLIKRFDILKSNSKKARYQLPEDFIGIHQIIRRASVAPVNWSIEDNMLVIEDYGHIDIYYKALPENVAKGGTFQVNQRLHGAIPYYIAYRIAKDYERQKICLEQWNKINSMFKMTRPKETNIRIGKYC